MKCQVFGSESIFRLQWSLFYCVFIIFLEITLNESVKHRQKMKIFQVLQQNFAILGIDSSQSSRKNPLNAKIFISLFMYGIFIVLSVFYILNEANNFEEYTTGIYSTASIVLTNICYVIITCTMANCFKFIDFLEITLNESEYNFYNVIIVTIYLLLYGHLNQFQD